MPAQDPVSTSNPPDRSATPSTGRGGWLVPSLLLVAAVAYFVFVGIKITQPVQGGVGDQPRGFLARCREICAQYGLVPSGNLADDAKSYLDVAQKNKLSDSLEQILADADFTPAESLQHPLVGQPAPDFTLLDSTRANRSLSQLRGGRPLVVVFYYGYWCNHCVAQLFGLDKDLHYFRELGADVVAISADSPEHTVGKFKEYGQFKFPVLSDPDNRVAQAYEVFRPATATDPEQLEHGTFVLGAEGKILWANHGPEPFLDNKTLLFVLAKATGKR